MNHPPVVNFLLFNLVGNQRILQLALASIREEEAKIQLSDPLCSQPRNVLHRKFDAYEASSIMFERWPLGHCDNI